MEPEDLLTMDRMIAPRLILYVYWIGLALLALMGVGAVLSAFGPGGLFNMIVGLVATAAGALVWRVICEVWIVMFEINDKLTRLAREQSR